jgi:hypothetical protein
MNSVASPPSWSMIVLLGMDAVLFGDAVAAQFPAVTKTYDMWQVV